MLGFPWFPLASTAPANVHSLSLRDLCSRKCCLTIEKCCLTIENGFATPEIAEPHYMLNSTKHLLVESSAICRGLSKPKCVRGSTDSRTGWETQALWSMSRSRTAPSAGSTSSILNADQR